MYAPTSFFRDMFSQTRKRFSKEALIILLYTIVSLESLMVLITQRIYIIDKSFEKSMH